MSYFYFYWVVSLFSSKSSSSAIESNAFCNELEHYILITQAASLNEYRHSTVSFNT